jgi:hypothetical protein
MFAAQFPPLMCPKCKNSQARYADIGFRMAAIFIKIGRQHVAHISAAGGVLNFWTMIGDQINQVS